MTAKNNDHLPVDQEITLKDLLFKLIEWWRYLLSKWLIILILVVIGATVGVYYSLSKKPIYTASTTFVLEDGGQTGGLGSLGGLASMAGLSLGGGGDLFHTDNIIKLYKSRKMVEKTLLSEVEYKGKKQLLIENYIAFNLKGRDRNLNNEFDNFDFNGRIVQNSRVRDSLITQIVEDINQNYLFVSKPDADLSIIKVDVKSKDEFFAKAFNDQIVKNVNDFYVQTKTKKSIDNVRILQHKTDSVRLVMNGAIFTAANVADATPNLNPTRMAQRVAPVQRAQFSAETNKGVLAEFLKNLELSKITLLKETPLIQVIDQPVFPLQKASFGKFRGALLGSILFGFLTVLFIVFRRILKNILAD